MRLFPIVSLTFASVLACIAPAMAQAVSTPNFWDQRQRMTKPALTERERIRFLTSLDYPPFNFLDPRGRLAGFNIDLVRAACDELGLLDRCQIEARPFEELVPALLRGEADAVVAGVAVTAENRKDLGFTQSYFRYPGRFVTRRDKPLAEPLALTLKGRRVAVVEGSAHAAMLRAFFPDAQGVPFKGRDEALEAVTQGGVDGVFGDGVALAFWLESDAAKNCCAFSGGPYFSDRYLGEGLSIAVRRQDGDLAQALAYAIGRIVEKKAFSELLLRYFPMSAF